MSLCWAVARWNAPARAEEVAVACEVFADRNYLADGSLVSRSRPDAILTDPNGAADPRAANAEGGQSPVR